MVAVFAEADPAMEREFYKLDRSPRRLADTRRSVNSLPSTSTQVGVRYGRPDAAEAAARRTVDDTSEYSEAYFDRSTRRNHIYGQEMRRRSERSMNGG